ncbi:similar to Saccharomyces cerevisiae YBR272C HSM3 Proteasome-interacting protein involved in the assembly of the base subcomplex of the 19S proteasomal regulatory particle (RP) [Maudiozyma barnettii]|uniref:DNA mismatch repair protein HSM3 n=1 Tax=Maudiozyma barnettii TaxID=61262 RepID=A0A8H2VG08_9SACH|nr:Hsm3p [Kazachstania barnettii]CAB4254548.1 similar to Saccharomyces cerevisiae YBR272C HSM3 Proteasome-interacting protein involved in the assembly of the base subcomplex of the 19S proteasomal regulatory particle (RP) [Kazachstania barnettii]CAD1782590.1 similar to Saccharomyces cerevisiae YBR272C HSM3 Proteasome-interacting protein involved in the assembly of the base subcomplex of the 19S proteasomal regulatory particle (RP) [Kazachstania barnettii]
MSNDSAKIPYLTSLLNELNESLLGINDDATDFNYINRLIERCVLNSSTLTTLQDIPIAFFLTIKNFLQESTYFENFDYEELLLLLDNLVSICPFEEITKIYTVEDLEQALLSNISYLIRIACKIIKNSQPLDYYINVAPSNTLFNQLLEIYFNKNTELAIINEIENILQVLDRNESIRNFILQENLPLLLKVKQNHEALITTRLYELLKIELSYIDPQKELNEKLFIFNKCEIFNMLETDSFAFVNFLQYVTSALKLINFLSKEITVQSTSTSSVSKRSLLLQQFQLMVPIIGTIYKDNITDVVLVAKSYFFKFFREVSYLPDLSYFRQLDTNDISIDYDNSDLIDFLSFVNPEYLYQYCNELIVDYVKVLAFHLSIWRNIIQHEKMFSLVKSKLVSNSILKLPYLEQMVLLDKLSQFDYSAEFLVLSLPGVMSNLINDQNVNNLVNPETIELRATVIRNLLKFNENLLNMWYITLTAELFKISHPGQYKEARTKIEETFI